MSVETESHAVNGIESGAVITPPLNALKPSPSNARKAPHGEAAIEALAASIGAKGLLQALVVEPELDGEGAATGKWLVTIGEGRRQALRLLAKRKRIAKTHPVRCVVDTTNDPHEISLDENVTRTSMHPADQFEAFRRLSEDRGLDAEEIAARFGVSANLVRQRLRLGAVSPRLMQAYRDEDLGLEQLMAFCVSEDHARQEQVYDSLGWNKTPQAIRRAMTETKVPADDRRARLVGEAAYLEAGGTILRDLFTEDGGGWFEDVSLLDRLAAETLEAKARELRDAEGWKWAEVHLDYPHGHGLSRVYPRMEPPTDEQTAQGAALSEEYDALLIKWDGVEDVPSEVEARFNEIDAALRALGDREAFAAEDVARGGVFVVLAYDGDLRIERGLIRPEDEIAVAAEDEELGGFEPGVAVVAGMDETADEGGEDAAEGGAALSDRMIAELTAYRTLGLRDALAMRPDRAFVALIHALAVRTFFPHGEAVSCLEIKVGSLFLENAAPGCLDSVGGRRIDQRHEQWAARLGNDAAAAWSVVSGLTGDELMGLLAHCVSLTVAAVRTPYDRRASLFSHADQLAASVDLDMHAYWSPTCEAYLGKVTKAAIVEAVRDGVSAVEAQRLAGLKKDAMAQAAERALAGTGWLPAVLRAPLAAGEASGSDEHHDQAA